MKNKICFFLIFFVAIASWASPKSKIYGAVQSKIPFSGERLFSVLDSVGGTGTWMEWDVNGVKDPSVMEVLGPSLASSNKPQMVWVISEREKPLMAMLFSKGNGEVLVFYELTSLDASFEPLKLNKVLTPDVVFRDYKQISANEFVHLDRPNLKVFVSDNLIRFTYDKADATPLRFDSDFSKKTIVEKKTEVQNYMAFLQYEYVLMLRAFVQSTRGLFNWQPWHWYMPYWNTKYFINSNEVEQILLRGIPPKYFIVMKIKAATGEMLEFRTTCNGFFELTISRN